MKLNDIYEGDCVSRMKELDDNSVDLIYFDPPFFTQRKHFLKTRDNSKTYEFSDSWESISDYSKLIEDCLLQCLRVLKETGNLFLHCDKIASHYNRVSLDKIFGMQNFQSEIIWSYKRWSNSKKGLLNSHQNIYYYTKSKYFKFNIKYTDYAPTTNVDQILQDRERTQDGKSIYKRDENGNVVLGKEKKGVPLSDVWEIPYLNPKAKERVGYPTQKPVLLLKQIIEISTDENDVVLDPFCGSGTACVAAKSLNRNFIGIDKSSDAVKLAKTRLKEMIITESYLLENGYEKFLEKSDLETAIIKSLDAVVVRRNKGIDGFLKSHVGGKPVPIKIQSKNETIEDCIERIEKASIGKDYELKIVIQTKFDESKSRLFEFNSNVEIIKSNILSISELQESTMTKNA